jgi:Fe-S-cluster containining protein
VTAPEVFRIARFVRETFTPDQLSELRSRLAKQYEDVRKFETPEQHQEAEIPCALLSKDGRCSVYDVRPVMCRGHTSTSAQKCDDYLIEWWDVKLKFRVGDKVLSRIALNGTNEALTQAGLDQPRELTEGMLVALETPDALERWLRGEPIFGARRKHPAGGKT